MNPTANALNNLLLFLVQLEKARIWYRLEHVRDSIMVMVSIPGERWEIEFFESGDIEIERFVSTGKIENADVLEHLIREHGTSPDQS